MSSDVGKSIHMAKIGNSVFKGHCAEMDCDGFGVYRDGRPCAGPRAQPLEAKRDLHGNST